MPPKLSAHLLFYWDAFGDLGSCRGVGMALGRIPWTAVKAYAETYWVADPDELAAFAEIIARMDQAYLDCQREVEKVENLEARRAGGALPHPRGPKNSHKTKPSRGKIRMPTIQATFSPVVAALCTVLTMA